MTEAATTRSPPIEPVFAPNAWYDALLAERDADRARFESSYSLATQRAVAAYEQAKARVQRPAQRTPAARKFDTPENTLRAWLKRGRLARHKIGGCVRIRVAELLALK